MSLGGGVRVLLRLRPPSALEIANGSKVVVSALPGPVKNASSYESSLSMSTSIGSSMENVAKMVGHPENTTVILAVRRAGGNRSKGRGGNVRAAILPELQSSLDGVITPGVNDQELVFAACRDTIVAVAFRGQSGTIFAYGPTGERKEELERGGGGVPG